MAKMVAKGTHNYSGMKLGAILGPETQDSRTLNLAPFLSKDVVVPKKWDFDHRRRPLATHMWGNDKYGDCELAARANYINRIQRAEQKKTAKITDDDIVELYKEMTGCEIPGDNNDSGLTTLDNLRQWRKGWLPASLKDTDHSYSIDAYGYAGDDPELMRTSAYLFNGILLGIDMPLTAAEQTQAGLPWDYVPEAGWRAEPGSWGGHCVYSKQYDEANLYVLTWGREVCMTEAFIKNYVVEKYAVIESFRTWKTYHHIFDVSGLIKEMEEIGIQVEQ